MDVALFDYTLPADRIAQRPVEPRDAARLLVDRGDRQPHQNRTVADLAELLEPGDVLVMNDTRVLPARLLLNKGTGGRAEVLLLEPAQGDGRSWHALVRPSRRLPAGTILYGEQSGTEVPVVEVGPACGSWSGPVRLVELLGTGATSDEQVMRRWGRVPLPPYIEGDLQDPERYQTVYADRADSVAAPTAGLHLTRELIARCRRRGISTAFVRLAVGLGTFRPMLAGAVEDHTMHRERYRVPAATMDACRRARRVIAVGTTTVRALETAAATGELSGRTGLFIRRPYEFSAVDVLLTNFHLPRSTLLVMIDAFVGPRWRDLYEAALRDGYRFLSFGDAMLLDRGSTR